MCHLSHKYMSKVDLSYSNRATMMMWFCPAVSTTAKTRPKISCLIKEVCNIEFHPVYIDVPIKVTWIITFAFIKQLSCQDLLMHFFLLLTHPHKCTGGPVRLRREVVLLTDDRNLRVKALTRNVPVRDIPAFLSWAKVGWRKLTWDPGNPTSEACLLLGQGRRHS